ncbi:acetamidase [Streptomyces asoensis]|uniref:Acetamidase n=1 Tax=Streptomyces asoensis TaxID=249586 RepID=A0A6M4WY72_9ACTN|nr:acetamidase/formamidase family protein [Streptomyces asoensis]QJT05494.1 acetamidase [Streptomyces asoensis]
MTTYTVESTHKTVRSGVLDPKAPPAATIESGDEVDYPNTWTNWQNEMKFGMSFAERARLREQYPGCPFQLIGPVEMAGSQPGDVIECRPVRLRLADWGCNVFPTGAGALPHDFDEPYTHYFRFDETRTRADYVHGISFALAPFLGIVAVEPAGDDPVSALPAGAYGGNLSLRELTVGSSLFLPVVKPGGRIWVGDVHALQGDGLVDQTAIKSTAEELRMRYDLHRGVGLTRPLAETDTHWIGFGFADNLDDALIDCVRGMISWVGVATGVGAAEAYALCSISASFRVTQYADQRGAPHVGLDGPPKGVHGLLPKDIFPAELRARVDRWLRPDS